ncbi:hypothetical protein GCM10020255_081830 [Rhodococcus baikonurensis]
MLFHAQFDETEIDPYMVQLTLELGGRVDSSRLRRASQALVDRHPSLRAGFVSAPGSRALQVIRSGLEISWAEIDLSGAEDGELAFGQLLERDRAHRFDMETAPLIRFMLVRTGPDTARFVVTNHHILLDGWSTPLLLRDLLTLYATDGDPEILPRVQSYRDYLTWISKQHPDSSLRAWQEALRGVDTSTQLSQASTAAETVASDIHSYSLPTERAQTLRAFARSRGLTMATLVQVAWGIVLAELLGRDDVVFGGTVSGRPPQVSGVESIVGLFINTVPVRVRLDARETLAELAIRVQSEQASLLDHHHIGLSDIAGAVGAAGSFDTPTVFESYPVDEAALTAETDIAGMHVLGIDGRDSAHYPIAVVASESDTLNLKMEYLPTHFSAREVAKITERVGIVLEQLASAPDQPLARLQVLTEFESRDLAPVFGPGSLCSHAPGDPRRRLRHLSRSHRALGRQPVDDLRRTRPALEPVGQSHDPPRRRARDVGSHRHRTVGRISTRGVGSGQDRRGIRTRRPHLPGRPNRTHAQRLRSVVRVDGRRRHRHIATHRVLVGARRRSIRRRRRHQLHAADHPGRTACTGSHGQRRLRGLHLGIHRPTQGVVVTHTGLDSFALDQQRRFHADHHSRTLHFATPASTEPSSSTCRHSVSEQQW